MPRRQQPLRPVRVRSKRLSKIDASKIALAYWLMAKRLIDEQDEAAESNDV
jgi:hypothetical protein